MLREFHLRSTSDEILATVFLEYFSNGAARSTWDFAHFFRFPEEPLRDFWFGYSRIKMPQHSLSFVALA